MKTRNRGGFREGQDKSSCQTGLVAQAYKPGTWEQKQEDVEFKNSLGYIPSSSSNWAPQYKQNSQKHLPALTIQLKWGTAVGDVCHHQWLAIRKAISRLRQQTLPGAWEDLPRLWDPINLMFHPPQPLLFSSGRLWLHLGLCLQTREKDLGREVGHCHWSLLCKPRKLKLLRTVSGFPALLSGSGSWATGRLVVNSSWSQFH